jgi:hypothetical protein
MVFWKRCENLGILIFFTSAQAFGRTKRPIRPASLALNTFSNNGTIVALEL